jgi:hypothetical protein
MPRNKLTAEHITLEDTLAAPAANPPAWHHDDTAAQRREHKTTQVLRARELLTLWAESTEPGADPGRLTTEAVNILRAPETATPLEQRTGRLP